MMIFGAPLHETQARARRRWIFAASFVVAMHVGSACFALIAWPSSELSEDFGAPMIVELSAEPSATDSEATANATGDPAESAPETPQVNESRSAARDPDQPVAPASPYQAPPDLQVAQEQTQKQTDDPQDNQTTEALDARPPTKPSRSAAASASSSVPMQEDKALVGSPTEGSTLDVARAEESWRRAIVAHLGKHKRYPQAARAQHLTGTVTVHFVLDRRGRMITHKIVTSSGAPILDQEVVALLERASPLPSLPPQMRGERAELTIPIRYKLK